MEDLRHELTKCRIDKTMLLKKCNIFEASNKKLKEDWNKAINDLRKCLDEKELLKKECETLSARSQDAKKDLIAVKDALKRKAEETISLRSERDSLIHRIADLKLELQAERQGLKTSGIASGLSTENLSYKYQCERLETANSALKEELRKLKESKSTLQDELSKKTNEIKRKNTLIEEYTNKLSIRESYGASFQEKYNNLEKKLDRYVSNKSMHQLSVLNDHIEKLNQYSLYISQQITAQDRMDSQEKLHNLKMEYDNYNVQLRNLGVAVDTGSFPDIFLQYKYLCQQNTKNGEELSKQLFSAGKSIESTLERMNANASEALSVVLPMVENIERNSTLQSFGDDLQKEKQLNESLLNSVKQEISYCTNLLQITYKKNLNNM